MSQLYINDVLTSTQKVAFNKLTAFKKDGILAEGTALALQLKHRRSFDFDIFISKSIPFNFAWEVRKIFGRRMKIIKESENELTFLTPKNTKITFFNIPLSHFIKLSKLIQSPFSTGEI